MISPRITPPAPLDELLIALDEQISLLEEKRLHLDELRRFVLDRDNEGMESLMQRMELAQQRQSDADARLSQVREALQRALGAAHCPLRLSELIPLLPSAAGEAVASRRETLLSLAIAVRRQHLETALVLHECSRINRRMLETLLTGGEVLTTYGAEGSRTWRSRSGLMDSEV